MYFESCILIQICQILNSYRKGVQSLGREESEGEVKNRFVVVGRQCDNYSKTHKSI
jgi:hypothetical protein